MVVGEEEWGEWKSSAHDFIRFFITTFTAAIAIAQWSGLLIISSKLCFQAVQACYMLLLEMLPNYITTLKWDEWLSYIINIQSHIGWLLGEYHSAVNCNSRLCGLNCTMQTCSKSWQVHASKYLLHGVLFFTCIKILMDVLAKTSSVILHLWEIDDSPLKGKDWIVLCYKK